jgi:hypothetical protein
MKKMILMLAVAVSSVVAFAGEENANIDSQVLNAFKSEFVAAQEVTWTAGKDFYKASFVYNGRHVAAFYSLDGELLGLTRNITSLELPVKLETTLKNNYSGYWISDLFELSNNDGTNYYVTLENADQQIVLKSTGTNNWRVYKKIVKA